MDELCFYDTETSGTDTTFDPILQFAAILTDADLNNIDRFETRCRLLTQATAALAPNAMTAPTSTDGKGRTTALL